eukprot:366145-Chlamydomonas_euryale.AAC.10
MCAECGVDWPVHPEAASAYQTGYRDSLPAISACDLPEAYLCASVRRSRWLGSQHELWRERSYRVCSNSLGQPQPEGQLWHCCRIAFLRRC